jgi:hypothetical protein
MNLFDMKENIKKGIYETQKSGIESRDAHRKKIINP